jgi:site-specific DNA recombinase
MNNEYIIYTRKSTDDAENQKNSIDYQIQACTKFCQSEKIPVMASSVKGFYENGIVREHHSGYKVNNSFTISDDRTITSKVDRPKFSQLMQMALNGQIKGIVCLCWDRISRNKQDDGIIERLLKMGIDIRFVQTTYDKSSSGALHMDIDGTFSRHYSRVISEKVILATNKMRSEGKCTYEAPIGYLNIGTSESKPFDTERCGIVKEIFEKYATGEYSYTSLATWAIAQGLAHKPRRKRRTKEERMNEVELSEMPKVVAPITSKTIENMLDNPFYIGKLLYKGEWIDSKVHQPLIDTALFYQVQAMAKKRTTITHYAEREFFTYRNMFKCTHCNRAYSPYVQKGIVYYRSKCKADCPNSCQNVNEAQFNTAIREVLAKISFTDDELAEMDKIAEKELNQISDKRNTELVELQRRQKKVFDDLTYLTKEKITMLRNEIMTAPEIRDEELRLRSELDEIASKMEVMKESAHDMFNYILQFSELVKNSVFYFDNTLDTERRGVVCSIFSELYFSDQGIKYIAKEGFSALLLRFETEVSYFGSPDRIRTYNLSVNSRLLYR